MVYLHECIFLHTSFLKNLVVYVTTLLLTYYSDAFDVHKCGSFTSNMNIIPLEIVPSYQCKNIPSVDQGDSKSIYLDISQIASHQAYTITLINTQEHK